MDEYRKCRKCFGTEEASAISLICKKCPYHTDCLKACERKVKGKNGRENI